MVNLVLNIDMDKKLDFIRHTVSLKKIVNDLVAQLDLIDAWRIINPDSRKYTWRRRRPENLMSPRFFDVSQSIMCRVLRYKGKYLGWL